MTAPLHGSSIFAGEHLTRWHTSYDSVNPGTLTKLKRLTGKAASQAVEARTSTSGQSDKDKPDWTGIAFLCFLLRSTSMQL